MAGCGYRTLLRRAYRTLGGARYRAFGGCGYWTCVLAWLSDVGLCDYRSCPVIWFCVREYRCLRPGNAVFVLLGVQIMGMDREYRVFHGYWTCYWTFAEL